MRDCYLYGRLFGTMRKITLLLIGFILLWPPFIKENHAQEKTGQPIDVVFCLDLSSSSNGLIDHLRNHIWDFWYLFSQCSPQPNYRIAVVSYARFSNGKKDGYSKVVRDLGTDFEKMSSQLFNIPSRIEKGDQYVGSALKTCLTKISWSKDPSAKKIIFLVGNGDVTTGPEDVDRVMDKLIEKDIAVYPIYITAPGETKAIQGWQRIAMRGRGKISSINLKNIYFDNLNGFDMGRFRILNRKFNNTYLYYGKNGLANLRMMKEEDNNIYIANTQGFRFRVMYKISEDFQKKNHSWDLVDLYYKNPVAFMKVDKALLNDTCRKMNDKQLKSYIIYKKYERKKLAALINEMLLNKNTIDKETGLEQPRNMPTLDVQSMKVIRDILRENGCACNAFEFSE